MIQGNYHIQSEQIRHCAQKIAGDLLGAVQRRRGHANGLALLLSDGGNDADTLFQMAFMQELHQEYKVNVQFCDLYEKKYLEEARLQRVPGDPAQTAKNLGCLLQVSEVELLPSAYALVQGLDYRLVGLNEQQVPVEHEEKFRDKPWFRELKRNYRDLFFLTPDDHANRCVQQDFAMAANADQAMAVHQGLTVIRCRPGQLTPDASGVPHSALLDMLLHERDICSLALHPHNGELSAVMNDFRKRHEAHLKRLDNVQESHYMGHLNVSLFKSGQSPDRMDFLQRLDAKQKRFCNLFMVP